MLSDRRMLTVTIPTGMGINTSKWIGTAFLFFAIMIDTYFTLYFILEIPALVVSIMVYLMSMYLLWKSQINNSSGYYLFAVDGMMGLFYVLFSIFT